MKFDKKIIENKANIFQTIMKSDYKFVIINVSHLTNFRTIERSLSHTENRNNCWKYYLLTRMYFNYDVKKEYPSR